MCVLFISIASYCSAKYNLPYNIGLWVGQKDLAWLNNHKQIKNFLLQQTLPVWHREW